MFKNFAIFAGKQLCWSLMFNTAKFLGIAFQQKISSCYFCLTKIDLTDNSIHIKIS